MNNKATFKVDCEVCGEKKLSPVLNLGTHPLCDDLIPVGDKSRCEEYPIEIIFCSKCLTAHQGVQVEKKTLFPRSYHYRSRFTADVLNGMADIVEDCVKKIGSLEGKKVLDVGCNDSSLLGFFKTKGALTIGIDPTDALKDGMDKGHHLIQGYFDEEQARKIHSLFGTLDVITFTNVFAHIEDLPSLLNSLKILIGKDTMVVIENHYLGAVLGRFQFDTFYHEHPRTYSATSFYYIAKSLNLNIQDIEFPSRYGGNIRVFMSQKDVSESELEAQKMIFSKESHFPKGLLKMQKDVSLWKEKMKGVLQRIVLKHGPIPGKAFPGRAAILIKLLGLDSETISAVYEKPGSKKIGNYLPGTRIPIKSDDELWKLNSEGSAILNLAWHIEAEIKNYLKDNGFKGEVIDILNPKDLV